MDTERKIIKAAQSTFLKKGYEATSLVEIARKVGINQAMIHYYFRSKKNLYIHVVSCVIHHEVIPLLKEITIEANTEKNQQLIDLFGKLIVKKYPWIIMILMDQEDPMHSEVMTLLNKSLESDTDFSKNENSINFTQKAMVVFAFSIFPSFFENFFNVFFQIEKSDYKKITNQYIQKIAQIVFEN